MSPLKTVYLSLPPRLRVPVSSLCVHRDRRPDLTVSGAHSPRFVFGFSKVFCFVPVCLSRGKEVTTRPSALARVKSAWEFGGIAESPLAASPHAHRSQEISAAGCGYPKPDGWLSSSRVAAPPSPPFAGVHAAVRGSPSPPFTGVHAAVRGSPRPAVRGRSCRRITTDSSPPAAADPSPVDLVHNMARSAVCMSCCAHRNILISLSCPRRLVWGRRLLLLWQRRPL